MGKPKKEEWLWIKEIYPRSSLQWQSKPLYNNHIKSSICSCQLSIYWAWHLSSALKIEIMVLHEKEFNKWNYFGLWS